MKQQEPTCVMAALVEAQAETEAMIARMSELIARLQRKIEAAGMDNPRQEAPPGVPTRS